jgi:hypothetical protein
MRIRKAPVLRTYLKYAMLPENLPGFAGQGGPHPARFPLRLNGPAVIGGH